MYDQNKVEEKWQQIWDKNQLFQQTENGSTVGDGKGGAGDGTGGTVDGVGANDSENIYLLFAFAYPSGSGLHVGHVESKTALDILARYYRMKGKNVFFPVGWDAFGLPAENYAIKTGVHPSITTVNAINTFRKQIKRIGISYDWANEIATSHPEYYRWTQWLFLQLYNKGLAYQKDGKVNWCPSCQTVLANEQVVEGLCERCDTQVEQKDMRQWYYQITKYQDELIGGLDDVDWPAATKAQQLNWIGKSEGINITFKVVDSDVTIDVFTTAPTNWGASFMVLAPEYPGLEKLVTKENKKEVAAYVDATNKKSELNRSISKEKTGVFTGSYVKNHVTGENMPVWISDFVLAGVGTGAVQGCPGHDMRDFEFAKKFRIKIPRVVVGPDGNDSPIDSPEKVIDKSMPGTMINSEFINGLSYKEGLKKTMDYFEEKGWGKRVTSYRLRDWLISRQRYWGTPIPVLYDPDGNPHAIKESHLPWELPTDVDFKPTGESPLKSSQEFAQRTRKYVVEVHSDLIKEKGWDASGEGWRPEFDTMDTFVDSSWYYLRYVDSRNTDVFARTKQIEKWLPVDLYMIGPEHIVLHLLYSRFFTKFLRDEGYFKFSKPFTKMRHQGMILGPDNKKMSKSKGNVISPDDIITKFGADTLRVYEMFMGPLESDKPWDIRAVIGIYKFLQKIHKLTAELELEEVSGEAKVKLQRKLHQAIKKVSDDIPKLKFNTAIAFMMEFVNLWQDVMIKENKTLSIEDKIAFIGVLAPFAPFLADELYETISKKVSSEASYGGVHQTKWPEFSQELAKDDLITIPVQINGKVRAQLEVIADKVEDEKAILDMAEGLESIKKYIDGQEIKKKIYIKGKILSLVI